MRATADSIIFAAPGGQSLFGTTGTALPRPRGEKQVPNHLMPVSHVTTTSVNFFSLSSTVLNLLGLLTSTVLNLLVLPTLALRYGKFTAGELDAV